MRCNVIWNTEGDGKVSWDGRLKRWLASRGMAHRVMLSALALFLITNGFSHARDTVRLPVQTPSERLEDEEEISERSTPALTVRARGGSFQLNDLRLVKESASTKLKGRILNHTGRKWARAVFEVRAFDERGVRLKGAEERTIFQINDFDEGEVTALGHGYGVWLEGISAESVSTLEVILIPYTPKRTLSTPVGVRWKKDIPPDAEE